MVKRLILGLFIVFLVVACAGLTFSYKYYGLQVAHYDDGKLLGPKPTDDLAFAVCEPTAVNKAPCVVMLSNDFFNLKKDYLDAKQKLIDCESQH